MTMRTTQTIVRFSAPFDLPGVGRTLPPGDYRVDRDDEPIDDMTRLAFRRVATYIQAPAIAARTTMWQSFPIQQSDLDAALDKDRTGS